MPRILESHMSQVAAWTAGSLEEGLDVVGATLGVSARS